MDKKRYEVELLILLLTYSMIAAKSIGGAPIDDWASNRWNNASRPPQVKYAQLFNHGANSYVRIVNKTTDATTTNFTDPDTYLQIDTYGPTLMAIRSYRTGEYICHNPQTGHVEIKVVAVVKNRRACLFHKESNVKSYSLYRSDYIKDWYLAFHGRGKKTGTPRKAQSSTKKKRGSMYIQNDVRRPATG